MAKKAVRHEAALPGLEEQLAAVERELQGARAANDGTRAALQATSALLQQLQQQLQQQVQQQVQQQLLQENQAPKPQGAGGEEWYKAALDHLRRFKRENALGACPLIDLYKKIAKPRGLTLGLFHDGVRALVRQQKVELRPYPRGIQFLQDSEYALVAGQEVHDRVELIQ